MTKRKPTRATKDAAPKKRGSVADSFQNFTTRVGIGAGGQNDAATYGFNPITRNRLLLEWMYRGSWICGKVVDAYAEDMTREGVEITSDDSPDVIRDLNEYAKQLQIWPSICEAAKWARLYGGGLGWLLIDGHDPSTPLKSERIGRDQFKGIKPLDRWMVQPSLNDLVTELGPNLGKPKYYDLFPNTTTGIPYAARIHHSRVIRLEGVSLPHWQRITENLWGISIYERMYDRLVPFDSATQGAAQLVYKAYLRTMKIDGLREIVAAGGDPLNGVLAQMQMMRNVQSSDGITLLDKNDEFETHQYTFSGLDNLLLQFGQQLGGATGIPLVRLFGQSPAGLNSTGESDWRNYYDEVHNKQETELRPDIRKVYELLYLSKFGRLPPQGFALSFRSLWKMTDEQKAGVTNTTTAAVVAATDSQVIRRSTALKELKQLAPTTGAFSNITDDEIKEAENDPAPTAEALGLALPTPAPNAGPEKKPGTKGANEDGKS
jgi:phage-related protein (TIGR01555 family)